MKDYRTFEKGELSIIINTLGHRLHNIAGRLYYFQQYAKLHNVKHDFIIEDGIEEINKSLSILRTEFNISPGDNICLKDISKKDKDDTIKIVNNNHRWDLEEQ